MGEGAERLMAAGIINMTIIILIITACLVLDPTDGFEVIQPGNQTVNRNVSASVRCEHTEDHRIIEDVRLNRLSVEGRSIACRWGVIACPNIIGYKENLNTYVFILLNVGAEDMTCTYECEVTAKKGDLYETRRGTPTRLLPGPNEASPSPSPPPSPPPPPPPLLQLWWILIGLLALMFLYSCAITAIYIRLRVTHSQELNDSQTYVEMQRGRRDPDVNSTYLEMRKATHLAKEIRRDT
ncbi:uncharacterized protein LOC139913437 isoform X2 [Centroberyx gerrardi]